MWKRRNICEAIVDKKIFILLYVKSTGKIKQIENNLDTNTQLLNVEKKY